MRKYVFIIVTLCMVLSFATISFGKTNAKQKEVYYELVDITKGDTLWTIAEEYNTEFGDVREYIEVIKEFNNMSGDHIKSGDKILVPVYV
ncbi:MAG: LysM peptidoglycan-binding domain-containing protein [Lachnospiraceae bacterium]|nr:LysM peptidoglycan-binding domain-containing protein [Lachnospiraceae bacterium]